MEQWWLYNYLEIENVAVDKSPPRHLQDRLATSEQHPQACVHPQVLVHAQVHRLLRPRCTQVRDQPQSQDSKQLVEIGFLHQTAK